MIRLAWLLVPLLFFAPGGAAAHGTGWRVTGEKAVVVELYYADGEQMPFADVRVFSPADGAVPVLHGRADARGRLAFVPDRAGTWTVSATDGDGHAVRAPVEVLPDAIAATGGAAPVSAALRPALLLSVLANVGLLLLAWRLLPNGRITARRRA